MHGFTLFHKSFRGKSIVDQLSGYKLEHSSKARIECEYAASGMRVRDESNSSTRRVEFEYATRLECDVTLELYRSADQDMGTQL